MKTTKPAAKKHEWISNRAFAALTGVKKTCLVCGETDPKSKVCPGASEAK